MGFFYWILSLMMAASLGIGISFLIFGSMLNSSNNLGDSISKSEEFSSEIFYLSQENNMPRNDAKFTSYVEMNIETLTRASDYTDRVKKAIKKPPQAMVERYIEVTEEDTDTESDVEAPFEGGAGVVGSTTTAIFGMGPLAIPLKNSGSGTASSAPGESSWAAARRRNLRESARENPWGRDDNWGAKDPDAGVMDEPTMDLEPKKKKSTQAEIDAFWSAGKKTTPSESPTVSPVAPAGADSAPAPLAEPAPVEEPIYEAPTATRPLWLNSNPDDDFSDFEDM